MSLESRAMKLFFIFLLLVTFNAQGVPNKSVSQDFKNTAFLAYQGNPNAQFKLAYAYANGYGVLKNPKEAVRWLRKSAEQGHPGAQYYLAVMYHEGNGVLKNPKEAFRWYRKAAEQGHAKAQNNLAVNYCTGIGTSKDLRKCAYWAKSADSNGNDVSELWNKFELWKHQ